MSTTAKSTIDGRPGVLEFARGFHHRHEHRPADLEKILRRLGFEITGMDEDLITILGPLRSSTGCRTLTNWGGAMRIRHFEVVRALERLLEVGVPVWETEAQQFEWHLRQLEQCGSFQINEAEEYADREEMQHHIDHCSTCQPSFKALVEAVNRGSGRTGDQHLKELVVRAHEDAPAAKAFYEQIRDSQLGLVSAVEKPQRAKREQVPA